MINYLLKVVITVPETQRMGKQEFGLQRSLRQSSYAIEGSGYSKTNDLNIAFTVITSDTSY